MGPAVLPVPGSALASPSLSLLDSPRAREGWWLTPRELPPVDSASPAPPPGTASEPNVPPRARSRGVLVPPPSTPPAPPSCPPPCAAGWWRRACAASSRREVATLTTRAKRNMASPPNAGLICARLPPHPVHHAIIIDVLVLSHILQGEVTSRICERLFRYG